MPKIKISDGSELEIIVTKTNFNFSLVEFRIADKIFTVHSDKVEEIFNQVLQDIDKAKIV